MPLELWLMNSDNYPISIHNWVLPFVLSFWRNKKIHQGWIEHLITEGIYIEQYQHYYRGTLTFTFFIRRLKNKIDIKRNRMNIFILRQEKLDWVIYTFVGELTSQFCIDLLKEIIKHQYLHTIGKAIVKLCFL